MRDAAGAFEEHVVWRLSDRLRWPFERLVWGVEERVVWPLQERAAGLGLPSRQLAAGGLAAVAAGALAVGAIALGGNGDDRLPDAEPVVAVSPAPAPPSGESSGPVLKGVAPSFGVEEGVGVAAAGGKAADEGDEVDASPTTSEADAVAEEAGATTSSQKPVPAGPAAMKVARRFSEAFVFYEIGKRPARAMQVFQETATPALATALAERPPRQPQGTEVPKARVLNLVPGPRSGPAYTVSASLLRVGAISELRLKLAKQAGAWMVMDVRG